MEIGNLLTSLNLGVVQRGELILLLLGFKEAAYINVYKRNDVPEKVKNAIEDSGLQVIEMEVKGSRNLVSSMIVGRSKKAAEELELATKAFDDRSIGLLLGYPASAVNAYVNGERLRQSSYPSDMQVNPLGFQLSKTDYPEEAVLIRSWMAALEYYTPQLYAELYEHLLVE